MSNTNTAQSDALEALRHLVHNIKASGKRIDLGIAMVRAEAVLKQALSDPASTEQERDAERWTNIGKAIERACCDLPDGYDIHIELERSAGTVRLYYACSDAELSDFESDTFDMQINRAIDAAVDAARAASPSIADQEGGEG